MNIRNISLATAGLLIGIARPMFGITPAPKNATVSVQQLSNETKVSKVLRDFSNQAASAADQAEQLLQSATHAGGSCEAQAIRLMALKADINRMGEELKQLEMGFDGLPPWQQTAVTASAHLLDAAAVNADGAILFSNRYPGMDWSPVFRNYSNNIRVDTEQIATTVRALLHYNRLREEELRTELKILDDGL